MKLWRRVSGAVKDRNSIVVASFTKKTSLRNPDIEAAVIRATSHDASRLDYKNSHRIFTWLRLSSSSVKPFSWAISLRMERTRSWVVALKGLILMHGVICSKAPAVFDLGRIPFDLSNFTDSHSNPSDTWAHNAFIRSYYAFLDHKSSVLFHDSHHRRRRHHRHLSDDDEQRGMVQELLRIQQLQGLLDLLIQIKPRDRAILGVLILEAVDCVLVEIFEAYGAICNGIAKTLVRIHSAGKFEAALAVSILHKANFQGEELRRYFDCCKSIGAANAPECPSVELIPEDDIRQLEEIIDGVVEAAVPEEEDYKRVIGEKKSNDHQSEKASVAISKNHTETPEDREKSRLKTIITDNWEVFDDPSSRELYYYYGEEGLTMDLVGTNNPFEDYHRPLLASSNSSVTKDFPDLITF